MMTSTTQAPRAVVVGISGPSASGKTTLTRLLRNVFLDEAGKIRVSVVHQDDFYFEDEKIPLTTFLSPVTMKVESIDDWDCAEAIDYERLASTVTHFRDHAELPGGLRDLVEKEEEARAASKMTDSAEDGESKDAKEKREDKTEKKESKADISEAAVQELRKDVQSWLASLIPSQDHDPVSPRPSSPANHQDYPDHLSPPTHTEIHILLVEGFLLYPPDPSLLPHCLFTTRLFLPLPSPPKDLAILLARRSTRAGYSTSSGGTWCDPPGYAEGVVWRNYLRDQAWLFDEDRMWRGCGEGGNGIECAPGKGEGGMRLVLEWAVGKVIEAVEGNLPLRLN